MDALRLSPPTGAEGQAHPSSAFIILLAVFVYFWIGIAPLAGPSALADMTGDAAAAPAANLLNQIIVISLCLVVIATIWRHPARSMLMAPQVLLLLLVFWFSFVSIFAESPQAAFRRIVFAVLVCGCANAALLLPRNTQEFRKLLAVIVTAALLLSYFAVLFMPYVGIHGSDELEEGLAGSWRGHLGHKNAAAAAMAFAVFIGLYLRKVDYPKLGACVVVLAGVFLYFSGGKTSAAMLPAVLLIAWIFERCGVLRYPLLLGSLLVLNYLLIGSALSPPLADWIKSLGIDETFTGRSTIWAFAVDRIAEAPITGYGFQTFWHGEEIKRFSGDSLNFIAAHAHNSFLETLINAGVPGLVLVVVWLVVLPIRDIGCALKSSNDLALTRLFLRIWLFGMYLACLEGIFFENTGPVWFTLMMGVFGLRLQARATNIAMQPDKIAAASAGPAVAGKLGAR